MDNHYCCHSFLRNKAVDAHECYYLAHSAGGSKHCHRCLPALNFALHYHHLLFLSGADAREEEDDMQAL
jgi:hypothetical protein